VASQAIPQQQFLLGHVAAQIFGKGDGLRLPPVFYFCFGHTYLYTAILGVRATVSPHQRLLLKFIVQVFQR
jgi:hypothetical protein